MVDFINDLNAFLWGIPILILIVMAGVYLTIGSGFAQLRLLPKSFRCLIDSIRDKRGGYKAMCTALAATVGTGNLAGVAGAIALGGPGVVFWMWVCGFLGMIIKLSEVILAMNYRKKAKDGSYVGGPMYVIQSAFPKRLRFLAILYAVFGVVASFGIGNATQINALLDSLAGSVVPVKIQDHYLLRLSIGVILAVLLFAILMKGSSLIGSLSEALVPVAAGAYILLSFAALMICYNRIPYALKSIIEGAFSPRSVTGGVLVSLYQTVRIGASRGVFTNEAGMGTASIAHAGSGTEDPVKQGLLGIVEVFLDTIVICTLTALVILCSNTSIEYGKDPGTALTMQAFSSVFGFWVCPVLSGIICVLAFATVLGWSLYGARCAEFLWGKHSWKYFAAIQSVIVVIASGIGTGTVWAISEIVNGLMAIPNLTMLIRLSPQCIAQIKAYQRKEKTYRRGGL